MKRIQRSLFGLMLVVAFVAVSLQAMRGASLAWSMAACNGAAAILLFAPIRVWLARRHEARSWWFGFAVFGWGYLLLSSGPLANGIVGAKTVETWVNSAAEAWMPVPRNSPLASSNWEANERYGIHLGRVWRGVSTIGVGLLGATCLVIVDQRARGRRKFRGSTPTPGDPPSGLA